MNPALTEQDLLDTINSLPTGVVLLRVKDKHTFVLAAINHAAKTLFQTDDNPIGRTIQQWKFPAEIIERMQLNCEEVVRSRQVGYRENPFSLRDGTVIWSGTTVTPILDEHQQVTQLMATTLDITELVNLRRAKERELTSLASGFVRICAWCSSIREADRWVSVDEYLVTHPNSRTEKVICPTCRSNS